MSGKNIGKMEAFSVFPTLKVKNMYYGISLD